MLPLNLPKTSENQMFSGESKGKIGKKRVKIQQAQYMTAHCCQLHFESSG